MANRTRSQKEYSGTGSKTRLNGALVATSNNPSSSDVITDFVAEGDGKNLDIRHLTLGGVELNYRTTGSISGRIWKDWMLDMCRDTNSAWYQPLLVPDRPSNALLAAQLVAETNPSRPEVDLPIAVYELREIPRLLKEEGDDILRGLAIGQLTYEFGLKPLVSDLLALLDFSDEVAKRTKELERLQSKGLKRRRDLWSGSTTAGPLDWTAQSGDKIVVHIDVHMATQTRVSGFVVWTPDNPKMMSKGDMRAKARRAVLGLIVDPSTAWNAIPWSWLIDWCSNVGDILVARRNIIGASHGPVQIMTHTITTGDLNRIPYNTAVTPGFFRLETKQRRTLAHIPVDVQLPIFNARQLSILGSIGVTRRRPRSS